MEKSSIEDAFKTFAGERLQNHLEEINTRYENEKPDAGVRQRLQKPTGKYLKRN